MKDREWDEKELMERILEVRLTDLEEEKRLCKKLLDRADAEQFSFSYAFANIYLVDSLLALGEYQSCDFYLIRADYLCREHGHDELLLTLCNFAGLYYQSLNDEQNALRYYLEGLGLAREFHDARTAAKLLNNIGRGFGLRGDLETSMRYFQEAYETIEPYLDNEENVMNAVSYLSNLASMCQDQQDEQGSEWALLRCDALTGNDRYQWFRLAFAWCFHYAAFRNHERFMEKVGEIEQANVFEYENKFLVFEMCVNLCSLMVKFQEKEYASKYLLFLEKSSDQMGLTMRFSLQDLKIKFSKEFGVEGCLLSLYQEYYDLMGQMQEKDDEARAQSLLSQIRLDRVLAERAALGSENQKLEQAGQVDDLTGLYNRRYFNKLLSKVVHNAELETLGFVLVDVDYFKGFNDFYGHYLGDGTLKAVADILARNAPEGVHISRYGGDEFVCLCVNQSDEQIATFAETVQSDLAVKEVPHEKSQTGGRLTLSIGWCNEPANSSITPDMLMQTADEALYEVKQNGRNGSARKRLVNQA